MKRSLVKILQSQGFGSRSQCIRLIRQSGVAIEGERYREPKELFETDDLEFEVAGVKDVFREFVYLAMNKPAGFESSHSPQHHDSVFSLLPERLVSRRVQCVGRLDVDTEGLLLFTDDGQFSHRITSPRGRVSKTYLARLKHRVSPEQVERLREGVELNQETGLFRAAEISRLDEHLVRLSVERGCYHQVRRMFAAVSNRVEGLRREAIGGLALPNLGEGGWCFLGPGELEKLSGRAVD